MKQLYYLSGAGKSDRWNDLCAALDIVVTWQDTRQVRSLTAFVTREKALYQQDFLLIDLGELLWSNEHILSAVQMLRRFFAGHLIFVSPRKAEITQLYGALANQFRVHALVYEGEDTTEHVRAFLQDPYAGKFGAVLGAVRESVVTQAAQTVSPFCIPPGLVITIAVMGAMPRCGTSTQAIAIYHYLASLGCSPAILDTTGRDKELMEFYAEDLRQCPQGHIEIKGIAFCQRPQENFNAYVLDGGVLGPGTALPEADIFVVVGGSKPWELPSLAAALALLQDRKETTATLVSFSTDEDMKLITPYLGTHYAPVAYHPDYMTPSAPGPYQKALLPCLKKICGDAK